jgi:adenylate cyclase
MASSERVTAPDAPPAGPRLPLWALLTVAVVFGANFLANWTTGITIELMRSVSPFAMQVRAHDERMLPYYISLAFIVPLVIGIAYLRPLVAYFRRGCPHPADLTVERRAISGPLVLAGIGFLTWVVGVVFFPLSTLVHFGRWSPDLMSQQVLSPLVNGFLAATVAYLLVDWVFRRQVIPRVFPAGRVADVAGALALGVRGRMLVFLMAVAFFPLFTLLGLVRAAGERLRAGQSIVDVMEKLSHASEVTFVVYVLLGVGLTQLLAGSLNRSVRTMARALRRVRANDLDVRVDVTSSDEVGVLEDGVNAMVTTLREKERILQTFGRVVEPSVRDRLLGGDVEAGGELRLATVLFCDLRGFSRMAERTPPRDVVATLNEFFTAMTTWVRECGGFVDKFVGDGMLVVFGLFADADTANGEAESAAAAIRCALGMRDRVVTLNASRRATGRPELAVKVGVHSGELVAGTIGAADRHEFTVIGDTVNVAARLQQLCGEDGRDVLVSDATYRLAASTGYVPPVGTTSAVTLRGRQAVVLVYSIEW